MQNRSIQIVTILALLAITGIVVLQIFWFRKAFDVNEKEFDQNVFTALQRVGEQILTINNQQIPNSGLVNQLSGNYFVVSVNGEIDTKALESLLKAEFKNRGLLMDFEYGVYDCNHQKLVYGNYVSFTASEKERITHELPQWKNDLYYFSVNFPDKGSQLTGSLGIWLFSSAVLLLVVLFFAFALITILRQKQLSQIQKDFVNNMTHEFKTPVSTILVTSKLLNRSEILQQTSSVVQYSNLIQQEALRLKNQVERVLQVAVWDEKKMKYQFSEIDLNIFLRNSILGLEQLTIDKGGAIEHELLAVFSMIIGDAMHLSNVIFNLVDNAVKYNEAIPRILISTRNAGQFVELIVKDNGIGIVKKNRRRIFDRFYRVPTGDVHDVKGFGLGLYYVKTVMKDHNGNVRIISSPGEGTEVILAFPLLKI
ncbi:MAG: HAMP domain-containing histidine kinase [Chitinophagales bacterium]|nr:HAMP domain-containing histidine kinase [Chitinophagales bacterium]